MSGFVKVVLGFKFNESHTGTRLCVLGLSTQRFTVQQSLLPPIAHACHSRPLAMDQHNQ